MERFPTSIGTINTTWSSWKEVAFKKPLWSWQSRETLTEFSQQHLFPSVNYTSLLLTIKVSRSLKSTIFKNVYYSPPPTTTKWLKFWFLLSSFQKHKVHKSWRDSGLKNTALNFWGLVIASWEVWTMNTHRHTSRPLEKCFVGINGQRGERDLRFWKIGMGRGYFKNIKNLIKRQIPSCLNYGNPTFNTSKNDLLLTS